MTKANWNYPTSIRFGAGRIKELPDACKAVGLKRPLLVTDPGLAKLPMIATKATITRYVISSLSMDRFSRAASTRNVCERRG